MELIKLRKLSYFVSSFRQIRYLWDYLFQFLNTVEFLETLSLNRTIVDLVSVVELMLQCESCCFFQLFSVFNLTS